MVKAVRGVVAGFEIEADLEFDYLRSGQGDLLSVEEGVAESPPAREGPIVSWERRPDNPFEASLFQIEERFVMQIPSLGDFGVQPASGRIVVPAGADPVLREERLWGVPLALCASLRGDLVLHSASVDVDGRALLICGPTRFGKTTLAAGFLRAGHRVLAEDLSFCRLGPTPSILPGPAMLRLRTDVWSELGPLADTHTTAEDPDRMHLALDERLRGLGDPVPLAGIVLLRRAASEPELKRVDGTPLLQDLFTMAFGLPTDADRTRRFEAVVELVGAVPVWVFDRPLRFDLLDAVVRLLAGRCLS
jgi:hypothetical protein